MKLLVLFLFCLSISRIESANVLMVFPVPVPSHSILGLELAKAIIGRGHNVTFVTSVKSVASKEKEDNITVIVLEEAARVLEGKNKMTA